MIKLLRLLLFIKKLKTRFFSVVLCCFCIFGISYNALGQSLGNWSLNKSDNKQKSQMLLSADSLVYNRDTYTVSAEGNVQIEYDGIKIVAQRVVYSQETSRVIAEGDVEIIQPDGTKTYSQKIDMTKDLAEGFINSLRVETTDNTRFAATSAERSGNQITVFNNGAYTACEPCYYKPDREVLWQVKARKIIWNGTTKTMRFEDGHMEFFGVPVAWFPVFEMPDPTVKRRSGFLTPSFSYDSNLGFGIQSSYFWDLAPNYDITLSPKIYTNQGLLLDGEWRHRLENGNYNLRFAYIYQGNLDAFPNYTIDRDVENRYMIASQGAFSINSSWDYGWNILAQSDHNFSRTYKLEGYSGDLVRDQFYLTGLAGRNYFDASLYHFQVQESMLKTDVNERYSKQPFVLPRVDYTLIPEDSVYGGQLSVKTNMQAIYRDSEDFSSSDWQGKPLNHARLAGMAGTSARLTNELEWKKTLTTQQGLVLTPLLAIRGDIIAANPKGDYNSFSSEDYYDIKSNAFRGIFTAGLEMRYPLLFTVGSTMHILEPTAQIFVRNDEKYTNQLPNEDSQSLVFDATTLFERDKFSGYDRVEGGTRANVGVRYSGTLNDVWSLYALAGQSFQLAGKNSYAANDFVSVGADSGLESTESDYVSMMGFGNTSGLTFAARGRFDEETFAVRRGELEMAQYFDKFWASTKYSYIESQPDYGYAQNRQEISLNAGLKVTDTWSVRGLTTYDLVSNTLVNAGAAINYLDECFGLLLSYQQTRNPWENEPSHSFGFVLSLRTIANFGQSETY